MVRKDERERPGVHDRIRFFKHKGKEILLVDLSNCRSSEVEQIARKAPDYVTARPPGSVLLLADFTGASFDQNAVWAMKESAVFDKPYIKKTAWIGAESFPENFKKELKNLPGGSFPLSGAAKKRWSGLWLNHLLKPAWVRIEKPIDLSQTLRGHCSRCLPRTGCERRESLRAWRALHRYVREAEWQVETGC